jgi:ketosteroid isomerase-like protein
MATHLAAHDDKPHAATPPGTATEALAAAAKAVSEIEAHVADRKLEGVHDQTDLLLAALKGISATLAGVGPEQKKRLEAAVRQVASLAESLHEAADGAQQKKAEAEAKKLAAAFKLLQAQLASGSTKPATAKPAASAGGHEHISDDIAAVKGVLAAYQKGLEQLDVSNLTHLFASDSQVFESGGVEGTFENYLAHHIGPELAEFSEFSFRDYTVEVQIDPPYAFTTETYLYKIVLKADGRVIERKGVATSVLKKTAAGWQIWQTHSSSRNPPKAK